MVIAHADWNVSKTTFEKSAGSFENAVSYLKKWIAGRTGFMDGEYGITEKHE